MFIAYLHHIRIYVCCNVVFGSGDECILDHITLTDDHRNKDK
jgi:hypothetical protein